jgi:hypothetical protein
VSRLNKRVIEITISLKESMELRPGAVTEKELLFIEYITEIGLTKLSVKDMEYLIKEAGPKILTYFDYGQFYSIASSNASNVALHESNKTMKWWTIAIGSMTGVMTICTIALLFKG